MRVEKWINGKKISGLEELGQEFYSLTDRQQKAYSDTDIKIYIQETGDKKIYWAVLGQDGRELENFTAVQEYLEEEANIQDESKDDE